MGVVATRRPLAIPVADKKKSFLLRIDPALHAALQRWSKDELRSLNAHLEYLLRRSLRDAGRLPRDEKKEES